MRQQLSWCESPLLTGAGFGFAIGIQLDQLVSDGFKAACFAPRVASWQFSFQIRFKSQALDFWLRRLHALNPHRARDRSIDLDLQRYRRALWAGPRDTDRHDP